MSPYASFSRFAPILLALLLSCSQAPTEPTDADENAATDTQEGAALLDAEGSAAEGSAPAPAETKAAVKPSAPRFVEIPAGTELQVRLDQRVSTTDNKSGDTFQAHLDQPIKVNDQVIVPAGAHVTGELTEVTGSGRVRGRAQLSMTLRSITTGGKHFALGSDPLTVQAEGTKKEDATKIGIGAAIGGAIGAIAGGGDGAAKGAAIGAGAGTGVVLATKGDAVDFDAETKLVFTLSEALKLPAGQ